MKYEFSLPPASDAGDDPWLQKMQEKIQKNLVEALQKIEIGLETRCPNPDQVNFMYEKAIGIETGDSGRDQDTSRALRREKLNALVEWYERRGMDFPNKEYIGRREAQIDVIPEPKQRLTQDMKTYSANIGLAVDAFTAPDNVPFGLKLRQRLVHEAMDAGVTSAAELSREAKTRAVQEARQWFHERCADGATSPEYIDKWFAQKSADLEASTQ